MNKFRLFAALFLAAFFLSACSRQAANQTPASQNQEPPPEEKTAPPAGESSSPVETVTVIYRESGFAPQSLTINQGDTVRFVNQSSGDFWPASSPHPIHSDISGFDAQRPIPPGGSYSFTFRIAKQAGFHNHLSPLQQGSITILPKS